MKEEFKMWEPAFTRAWQIRAAHDRAAKLRMKIRKVASAVVKGAIIMALAGSIIANFMVFYMLPKLAVS